MFYYALPLLSLLLSFMAFLTTLRFILSREGAFWLLPCLISIIMTFQNLDTLISIAEMDAVYDPMNLRNLAPLLIAVLWYMSIVTFHYALRFKIEENRYRSENKKNRMEAQFIEKVEQRRRRTERKIKEDNIANKARIAEIYDDHWSDLFSE